MPENNEEALKSGNNIISKKKATYPINKALRHYLKTFDRETQVPCNYKSLLRYSFSMPLIDQQGKDTLWETVFYDEHERYIEASKILSTDDKHQIYEGNVRRVFSRLDARLRASGR